MAATTSSTEEVYPDEIQELLKDSRLKDVFSIAYAAVVVEREEFTEKNRLALEKELSSMKTLHSGLVSLRVNSDEELNTLSEIEESSLLRLVKIVPNIEEMPQYSVFTPDQRLAITDAVMAAERLKELEIAKYDAVKELFSKIEPLELASILKVPLELAEQLKNNLQTTSNDSQEPSEVLEEDLEATMDSREVREPAQIIEAEDLKESLEIASKGPQEPSQVLEDQEATMDPQKAAQTIEVPLDLVEKLKESLQELEDQEATMDPQKRAQKIEDICCKLRSFSPRIKVLRELFYCCLRLVRELEKYISALESWLKEAAKKEREEKVITQKENATKKDIKWERATDIRRSWKY